jgi:hypothetical protein
MNMGVKRSMLIIVIVMIVVVVIVIVVMMLVVMMVVELGCRHLSGLYHAWDHVKTYVPKDSPSGECKEQSKELGVVGIWGK